MGITGVKENDSKKLYDKNEMLLVLYYVWSTRPNINQFKTHKEVANEDAKYLGDHCDYQFEDKNRMGLHRVAFHEAVSM